MIAMWVKVRVKPEGRERFLKAIEVDALGSERDEARLASAFKRAAGSAGTATSYYFYEVYRDEKALEAHRAAPHYAGVARPPPNTLDGPPAGERAAIRFFPCGDRLLGAQVGARL